jgi:predicted sulfurtransferase
MVPDGPEDFCGAEEDDCRIKGKRMKVRLKWIFWILLGFLAFHCASGDADRGEVPRITKEELKARMDDPDLVILDVRTGRDWENSARKIKGAIREDPEKDTKSWAHKYGKDKTLVLYCS